MWTNHDLLLGEFWLVLTCFDLFCQFNTWFFKKKKFPFEGNVKGDNDNGNGDHDSKGSVCGGSESDGDSDSLW